MTLTIRKAKKQKQNYENKPSIPDYIMNNIMNIQYNNIIKELGLD